jgi:hypothetical protein
MQNLYIIVGEKVRSVGLDIDTNFYDRRAKELQ